MIMMSRLQQSTRLETKARISVAAESESPTDSLTERSGRNTAQQPW